LDFLISQRNKRGAFNDLIFGNVENFDPVIGDASCQLRVPLVLDLSDRISGVLNETHLDQSAKQAVLDYVQAHKNDKAATQVKTIEDATGAAHSRDYDFLIAALEAHLDSDERLMLSLFKTFSLSTILTYDEFGTPYSARSLADMRVATPQSTATGDQKDTLQLEQPYKHHLADLAIAAFKKKLSKIPRTDFGLTPWVDIAEEPVPRSYIEDQLIEAFHWMGSAIPAKHSEYDIPLLPIFNTLLAVLYIAFHDLRPIIIRIRRQAYTSLPDTSYNKPRFSATNAGTCCRCSNLTPRYRRVAVPA
jgi:hypothetical protein